MPAINYKVLAAICFIALLFGVAYAKPIGQAIDDIQWPWEPPPVVDDDDEDLPEEVQWSPFKYSGVRKDATATAVTGATTRIWYDANGDDVMQYSELGSFTEATGVYTSNMEYPINIAPCEDYPDGVVFDLWVQVYATSYQITYEKLHMTGQRNTGGEAKNTGEIELILTDDSITWSGRMNGVDFDTTDYNATLSGTSGTLECEFVLSAADYGLSSQVWEGIDYQTVYGESKTHDYVVKWDEIGEGTNDAITIAKTSFLAPTFFCAYSTVQDKVDGQINVAEFDLNFDDGVNWYCISMLTGDWGDLFYNTADSTAPRPNVEFDMGTISAGGTFLATYGIGMWQGVTYDEMLAGSWTKGTALALGTCGDAWGWTIV